MEDIFELIGTYQYSSEAIIYKGKLESEGIAVFMRDNYTVDSNPLYSNAVGGVKLFVNQKDYPKAKDIISQVSQYSLDDDHKLLKCPNCGAEQIDMVTSVKDLKSLIIYIFSLLLGTLPFYSKHKYKCNKCNFEFN
ncbi:DUF2007 domain-containing protein [Flavobacterium alvei]|uniref:DUF2007 domain-containing protein n=1 Tax=Flavobacterium alvei TaxID=2080416 RepID=UPI0026F1D8DD|nr:DUF2007 domain-containing protein [Flavobacterium alvei]